MPAGRLDLHIEQGATYRRSIIMYHAGGVMNGVMYTRANEQAGNVTLTVVDSTIARNKGSWIEDGFAVGEYAHCEDFLEAANNGLFLISAVTHTDLTFTAVLAAETRKLGTVRRPMDFTGKNVRAMARKAYADAAELFSFTCSIPQPEYQGKILWGLTKAETEALVYSLTDGTPEVIANWDMELYDDTDVDRLLYGSVDLSPENTKPAIL